MHKFNFVDVMAIATATLIHALNDGNLTYQVLWLVAFGSVYLLIVLMFTDKHQRVKPLVARAVGYTLFCLVGAIAVRWLLKCCFDFIILLFRRDSIIHW